VTDPFLDSLNERASERGPFRTAEPTEEERYGRAREASFGRVERATAIAMHADRRHQRHIQRALVTLLGLSCVALSAVVVMGALGETTWLAWICPALAAVFSFAIATWKNRALNRAWERLREYEEEREG